MEEMNLEEMRNQFAILKEQLDKQEIVSDHLLRETMKAKNKDINFVMKFGYWLFPVVIILYLPFYLNHITSLTFYIVTSLLMVFGLVCSYYMHRPVNRLNFMTDDFATVARVLKKFKKQKMQSLYISLPVLLLWIGWACYELIWKHGYSGTYPWLLTFSALFGAFIGGIIGFGIERKALNAAKEIIDEIERNE